MLKMVGKKIFTILRSKFLLSKPVIIILPPNFVVGVLTFLLQVFAFKETKSATMNIFRFLLYSF